MLPEENGATEIDESAPEEVGPHPGQETEWGAEALEYIQSRKEALGFEEGEESGQEEASSEEVEETPAEEPEAEGEAEAQPAPEPASRAARRALAREKKLRAEREQFESEREQWKSEQQERVSALEAFERAREDAALDPVGFLTEAGLDQDALLDAAREIYYTHMPDAASPEVKAQMDAMKRERRLKRLERGIEEKSKPPEPEETPAVDPAVYEAQYRSGLVRFAARVDAEKFPNAAAYAEKDFDDLVDSMFTAAVQGAQTRTREQGDLTPEECMAVIENFLAQNQPQSQKQPEPQIEEEPVQTKKAPLRNKVTATRPSDKHEDSLSYEELKARSRERFEAKMRENGMIK